MLFVFFTMKKIFVFLLSFLVVALITVSCNKENQEYSPRAAQTSSHQAVEYTNIGAQHNDGLEYFLHNADFQHSPKDQVGSLTLDYLEKQGYDRAEAEKILSSSEVVSIREGKNPADIARAHFKEKGLDRELEYFNKLEDVVTHSETAGQTIEQLEEIGQAIEADKELTEEGKTSLLNGVAVGKSSAAYWYAEAEKGKENPWTTAGEGSGTAERINWGVVLFADVSGAVLAGLPGAIFFSLISVLEQVWP